MKLILELNNIRELNALKKYNSIIKYIEIGIENYSFCSPLSFKKEEINQIIEKITKFGFEVIINFERVYTDIELNDIKTLLDFINLDKVAYFTHSDLGFNYLLTSLNLKDKLIFRSPTYLTNYSDIQIYQRFNKYVTISSEISSDELLDIVDHINDKVCVDIFGQNAVFHSRRKLVTNFFNYKSLQLDPKKDNYQLIEELRDEPYPIREYNDYTVVFEPRHYFLDDELIKLINSNKVELGFIHTINMTCKDTIRLLELLVNYIENQDETYLTTIKNELNTYSGAYGNNSYLLKSEVKENE